MEVTFLVYEGTLQAEALGLVAAKTRASLMVEGELPEEGLAALGGDGGDIFLALARRLAEPDGAPDQRQSLEVLFAEARRIEDDADEPLIEGDWDAEAEPDRKLVSVRPFPALALSGALGDLPLFAVAAGPSALPAEASAVGKVVTIDQLALFLRRPKLRRKVVTEGQLALFET